MQDIFVLTKYLFYVMLVTKHFKHFNLQRRPLEMCFCEYKNQNDVLSVKLQQSFFTSDIDKL